MSIQLPELRAFILKLDAWFIAWAFSVAFDTSVAEGPGLITLGSI